MCHHVNKRLYKSMYLRTEYNITRFVAKNGNNRLAIIVYPPDSVGNPNGGQGGDGKIAHSITGQYTAGWDWIQPVRDRNTGIWDKVFVRKTGQVKVQNTRVVTDVPGARSVNGYQQPAIIKVSTELENAGNNTIKGILQCELDGSTAVVDVTLPPHATRTVAFPVQTLRNPKLWWPNGYGPQNLYKIAVSFRDDKKNVSEVDTVQFGVRQLDAIWNAHTMSREISVNGQKIFIKGGNRILSDALLRFSKDRYDAEIRYHRDMNLNFIRVWGGGITERPEFYDACDRYGLLVMQDFWVSGDCNGRWYDPMKSEDTNTRRKYPDDHRLFVETLADQIKMLRNHPSLAIWCGGNEIRPPADILATLRDTLLPTLDGTRFFFEYSNDDSMSYHSGDGPYTVQRDTVFWSHRSFPFNSEVGSVGIGDYESIKRFIPTADLVPPVYDPVSKRWIIDSVWLYHKYIGYDSSVEVYGHPRDVQDFAMKSQLVNYNQYRSLIEGFTSHMWDWYTGVVIWKTQNPWTAMLGQMYDVYLDPNACMYGLAEGSKPLHVMYNPIKKSVMIANNTFEDRRHLKVKATVYDFKGHRKVLADQFNDAPATDVIAACHFGNQLDKKGKQDGMFLSLQLLRDMDDSVLDENVYWLPGKKGRFKGLEILPPARVTVSQKLVNPGIMDVTLGNPGTGPFAVFISVSLVDPQTNTRILPVFCNNNYISLPPGQQRTIRMEYRPQDGVSPRAVVEGWNVNSKIN